MRKQYLLFGVLGAVILVIHGVGWAGVISEALDARTQYLPKPEVVASNLSDMELTAKINLERSKAIAEAVRALSEKKEQTAMDPFLKPPDESEPESSGEEQPQPVTERVSTAASESEGLDDAVLEGVVVNGEKSLAMISGELYSVGARIGSMKLVEVKNDAVVLVSVGGVRHTLELTGWEDSK